MAKKLKYANEDVVVGYAVKDDKGNKLSDAVIKANNSLQLPETAPTETKIVGVGADKSQTIIDIGDGLILENNTLKTESQTSSEVNKKDIQNMLVSSFDNTETWILPQNLPMNADGAKTQTWDVNFTSNNTKFNTFTIHDYYADGRSLYYGDTRAFYINYTATPAQYIWVNDAYRIIVFDESISGTLKTWLVNHGAEKQGDTSAPNKNSGEMGTIKNNYNKLDFYPKTFMECVYDENGNSLDTLMPVANLELDGTEESLTSITINNTKYKIEAGGSGGASANYNYYWED